MHVTVVVSAMNALNFGSFWTGRKVAIAPTFKFTSKQVLHFVQFADRDQKEKCVGLRNVALRILNSIM